MTKDGFIETWILMLDARGDKRSLEGKRTSGDAVYRYMERKHAPMLDIAGEGIMALVEHDFEPGQSREIGARQLVVILERNGAGVELPEGCDLCHEGLVFVSWREDQLGGEYTGRNRFWCTCEAGMHRSSMANGKGTITLPELLRPRAVVQASGYGDAELRAWRSFHTMCEDKRLTPEYCIDQWRRTLASERDKVEQKTA